MKIKKAEGLGTLHQEWVSGEFNGVSFELTCGAGLGSSRIYFSIGDARYEADVRDLVQEFIDFHSKDNQ